MPPPDKTTAAAPAAAAVLNDSLFMRALRCQPTARRPVWLMRQAGRYLPEYRRVRAASGGFLQMIKTPELACEVTLQPITRFGFDAAIIFSDILVVPDALRLGLSFVEGEGPRLAAPLADERAVRALPAKIAADEWRNVADACALTRRALPLDVPLIGFAGAPFTLACYMIDGRGGDFFRTRGMLRARPDLVEAVLNAATDAVISLLLAQISAGCQAVMLFDSWGGLLADDLYEKFSLRHIRRVVAAVAAASSPVPVIVFGRQCGLSLTKIAQCGCAAVGVDWQTSLPTARRLLGDKVALQGNLDPAVLLTDVKTVAAETEKTLASYGGGAGHIFNLGHGVDKRTPPEHVAALAETVRGWQVPTG